jgi:hypothetical protein
MHALLPTSQPNQMMRGDFIEDPIRPLLVQPLKRVRAFHAVVIGARGSYVNGGSLASDLFDHFGRGALLGK